MFDQRLNKGKKDLQDGSHKSFDIRYIAEFLHCAHDQILLCVICIDDRNDINKCETWAR